MRYVLGGSVNSSLVADAYVSWDGVLGVITRCWCQAYVFYQFSSLLRIIPLENKQCLTCS